MQVEIARPEKVVPPGIGPDREVTLRAVSIFSSLSEDLQRALAQAATWSLYEAGDVVVRQGDAGTSMFVVARGEVIVALDSGQEVARIGPGGFVGEMSLLTGAPRNATARTAADSELLEITGDAFRQFVLANPATVEQIGAAVAHRRAELEERRASGAAAAQFEPPHTLIDRIRRYLSL
jgi:CRP-like cAMP-binding protein